MRTQKKVVYVNKDDLYGDQNLLVITLLSKLECAELR